MNNRLFDALTGYKIKMDPLSVEGEQNIVSVRIIIIAGIAGGEGNRARYDLRIRHIDCDFPAAIIIDAEVSLTVGITRWVDETRNAEDHL